MCIDFFRMNFEWTLSEIEAEPYGPKPMFLNLNLEMIPKSTNIWPIFGGINICRLRVNCCEILSF